MKTGRRTASLMIALLLAICCTGALAEGSSSAPAAASETVAKLLNILDFKFFVREDGIGKGSAPVYTAPDENSLRLADSKASCNLESEIAVAGHVDHWLMVRYEIGKKNEKDKKVRVGYIPPKYVKGFKSPMPTPQFDYIPVTADDIVYVSDNPLLNSSYFATLEPGETFYILGKYTYIGDWWYIECTVDNQLARGFINRETSSFILGDQTINKDTYVPEAVLSPLGTEKIGTLTVGYGTDGAHKTVRQDADPESKQLALVSPGEKYPCYAEKKGTNGKPWYYIWIEKESVWGWISSGVSTLAQ